jgi:hypothetical protein
MVEYSCDKCGNDFKQKSHLKAHMNRKNPCVKESKIQKEVIELKNNKNPIQIDLILDGGIFNGSYLIGALYYLKQLEERKIIKINQDTILLFKEQKFTGE